LFCALENIRSSIRFTFYSVQEHRQIADKFEQLFLNQTTRIGT
jgi:hypothetical protein